jgi:DHA3 family macrolide efflux protein-like MFS transporter
MSDPSGQVNDPTGAGSEPAPATISTPAVGANPTVEIAPFPEKWWIPFFTIWTGQIFSLLGSSLAGFALIWYLTQSTGSATVLATASLFSLLPQVVLGPLVGTLVDRWSRRRVMIIADSAIALVSLGLAYLFYTGQAQVWIIFVVMMLRSLGGAFHYPAMSASTSLMVPEKHLSRVAGMNQTLGGVMNIIAPPLGALLVMRYPIALVLLIDVITALIAVTPLFFVNVPQPVRRQAAAAAGQPAEKAGFWKDFAAGFRYVAAWKGMLLVLVLAMVLNFLLTPTFSLLPLLVTRHFNGGALQLGMMDSTFGIGMVIGGLVLSTWGGFKKRILTSLMGVAMMGVGVLVVGVAPAGWFAMGIAGVALTAFANPIANGPLGAILQASVAPDMQGRVFSMVNSLASLMSPLSLAVAGPLSDLLGIQVWFIVSGLACVVMALIWINIPAVMSIENARRQVGPAEPELAVQPSLG